MVECKYCGKKFKRGIRRNAHELRIHEHGDMSDEEFVEWFESQSSLFKRGYAYWYAFGWGNYPPPICDAYVPKMECPCCSGIMILTDLGDEGNREVHYKEPWWQCTECDNSMSPEEVVE